MGRLKQLAVLTTLLVATGISCKSDENDNSSDEDLSIEEMLKNLETSSDMEEQFDLAYAAMDKALRDKDLSAFVEAYRAVSKYKSELINSDKDLPPGEREYGFYLNVILTHRLGSLQDAGIIFNRIHLHYPGMLEDWPDSCPGDPETETMVRELIDFNSDRAEARGYELPPYWAFRGNFDDETIERIRNAALLEGELDVDFSVTYPDSLAGRYADFAYGTESDLFMFSLTDVSRPNPLELKVERPAEVIDLGADGIDRCDARLNGVPESQIDEANARYRKNMAITKDKMKERYPTHF